MQQQPLRLLLLLVSVLLLLLQEQHRQQSLPCERHHRQHDQCRLQEQRIQVDPLP